MPAGIPKVIGRLGQCEPVKVDQNQDLAVMHGKLPQGEHERPSVSDIVGVVWRGVTRAEFRYVPTPRSQPSEIESESNAVFGMGFGAT